MCVTHPLQLFIRLLCIAHSNNTPNELDNAIGSQACDGQEWYLRDMSRSFVSLKGVSKLVQVPRTDNCEVMNRLS